MHHFHLIQTWNNWSFSLSLTIAKRPAPAWPALAQIINPGLTSALPTILTYQSYCWPPTGCLIKIGVKSTQGVRTIHSTLMSTKSLYLWLIFVSDIPPNYPSQPVSSSSRAEWTQSIKVLITVTNWTRHCLTIFMVIIHSITATNMTLPASQVPSFKRLQAPVLSSQLESSPSHMRLWRHIKCSK